MDFDSLESWLASWFVRRVGLERYVALEAAERLLYDMEREAIEIKMWRPDEDSGVRSSRPQRSSPVHLYGPNSRRR